MAKGQIGVIHTNSSYAPDFIPTNIINSSYTLDVLYDEAFKNLQEAELSFYHEFFPNVNTFEQFIEEVRKIFNNAEEDKKALLSCSNASLSEFLPDAKTPIFNQNLQVVIDGNQVIVDCAANLQNIQMKGKIVIDVIPANIGQLKHYFNQTLTPKGHKRSMLYDENNLLATRNLKREINELYEMRVSNQPSRPPQSTTFDITQVTQKAYNKDEIQKLINDPSRKQELAELRLQAQKSILKMYHFIFNDRLSGASETLKTAAKAVWNEIFPKSGIADDVLTKNFWFEGENYIKSLLGQGGEFFNDVIIRYLQIKSNNTNSKLVQIIGSILKGGQQPHSDLQIITSLGGKVRTANFQTKNIDIREDIDINTNAQLIQKNFGTNFVSALVNYYSNTDTQKRYGDLEEQVKDMLTNRWFQAMNLNIKPGLDDFQTNTFYLVSGTEIVPGSKIIEDIKNNQKNPTFIISGKNVVSSDDDSYRQNFEDWHYWWYQEGARGVSVEDMVATTKNYNAFRTAASSISISTTYNFNRLLTNGDFTLFK